MTPEKQEAEKRILEMQRDLMTAIMDFQIGYGTDSISWNVNVQFSRGK